MEFAWAIRQLLGTGDPPRRGRLRSRARSYRPARRRGRFWPRLAGLAGIVFGPSMPHDWLNELTIWFPEIAMPADVGAGMGAGRQVRFGYCHTGGGANCVVDGDTFWMGGRKVRIADIDTPETHPGHCASERRLGKAATLRLQELLNDGPVTLVTSGRSVDRCGRRLRVVERDGESLGQVLVSEGLARPWEGRRRGWCGVRGAA